MDEKLRQLERQALTGDPEALKAYQALLLKTGQEAVISKRVLFAQYGVFPEQGSFVFNKYLWSDWTTNLEEIPVTEYSEPRGGLLLRRDEKIGDHGALPERSQFQVCNYWGNQLVFVSIKVETNITIVPKLPVKGLLHQGNLPCILPFSSDVIPFTAPKLKTNDNDSFSEYIEDWIR